MEDWKLKLLKVAYQRQVILSEIFNAWVEVILFKLNKGIINTHRFESEIAAVKERPGLALAFVPDEHPVKAKYKVITKYKDARWVSIGFKTIEDEDKKVYFETDKSLVTDAMNQSFIKYNLRAVIDG